MIITLPRPSLRKTQVLDWKEFFNSNEKAEKKPLAVAPIILPIAVTASLLNTQEVVLAGSLGDVIRKATWPLVDASQALAEIAFYIMFVRGLILFGMDRKKQGITQMAVSGIALVGVYLLPGFGGIARAIGTEILNATTP